MAPAIVAMPDGSLVEDHHLFCHADDIIQAPVGQALTKWSSDAIAGVCDDHSPGQSILTHLVDQFQGDLPYGEHPPGCQHCRAGRYPRSAFWADTAAWPTGSAPGTLRGAARWRPGSWPACPELRSTGKRRRQSACPAWSGRCLRRRRSPASRRTTDSG